MNPVSVILAFIALILMGNAITSYMRVIIKNQQTIIKNQEAISCQLEAGLGLLRAILLRTAR